jgi:predicted kinase
MSDNSLIVWICIGAPGSGKSTWSKVLIEGDPAIVRVCPDDNRRAISGDSNNQAVSYPAFCMAKDQMRNALASGKCVVLDATNMYKRARKDFINMGRGKGAKIIAVVFECTKNTLLTRNEKRATLGGRKVSEEMIDNMLSRYQQPDTTEFDEVMFVSKL